MSEINTGGGAAISGNANAGHDLIGRDQNIFLTVINQFSDEAQKHEQDRTRAAEVVAQWQAMDPAAAEERYRQSLIEHYNRLRIFGTSGEVALQNIFTDVYIFAEPVSRIPYDFEALRRAMTAETRPRLHHRANRRINGMQLVDEGRNLFILGKPGAGKTTFLKYLTVQAAQRKLARLPIFISLNEWANSRWGKGNDPQLMPFIVYQFRLCHFDEGELFVETLLRSGHVLVLFDGLDEVRQEDEQRRKLTQLLKDFARQYDRSQHLITCRIAASDYVFPSFRDVEVADFTDDQINKYAELWFHTVGKSHETFVEELVKPENAGVHELCNSPLLLSMVCLYFERVMRFPPNRAELYEDAIEALLNKWDSSRDILRDEIPHGEILYRELSPRRKEQMFAAIAARTFEAGDYYFRRRDLAKWINDYLHTLPNVKADDEIDNNAVLGAIEAQHGIFVERARDIYSFSHLTFQEYFTARYIFDNERRGTTARLLRDHLTDNRWREVFLLTASLFDREGAEDFFKDMSVMIDCLITNDQVLQLLTWVSIRTTSVNPSGKCQNVFRLAYIILGLAIARDFACACKLSRSLACTVSPALSKALDRDYALALTPSVERDRAFTLVRELSIQVGFDYALYYAWSYAELFAAYWWPHTNLEVRKGLFAYKNLIKMIADLIEAPVAPNLMLDLITVSRSASSICWQQFANNLYAIMLARNLVHDWQFTDKQINQLNDYLYANELLVQCLNVAVVSDRQAILAGLLAPPPVDKQTQARP